MECGFDAHKNALIKNLVILFDFFCAVEPIYYFFQTDVFFDLINYYILMPCHIVSHSNPNEL